MHTLYHSPYSQHARRVVALMEAAGLDHEIRPVDMENREFLSPSYLAVNPNHQVPTLVDSDIKIFESNAILRYLCLKHGLKDWYPEDLKARAAVEQWLDWNQCRLSPAVVDIVLNTVFMGEHGDQGAIERGREALKELSAILDDALDGQDYLTGDSPTIADLSLASNITQLAFADAVPQQPNIQAWYRRVCGIEGYRKSLPQA